MSTLKSGRRNRIERSIQRSREHPVEPGKCCAMCIEVGCEELGNCICKPLKFAWHMGKETGKCCAECAKEIEEGRKEGFTSATVAPLDVETGNPKVGGRRTRKRRKRRSMCARLTNKACKTKRYKKRCKTTRRKKRGSKGRKSHCRTRKNRFAKRTDRKRRRTKRKKRR